MTPIRMGDFLIPALGRFYRSISRYSYSFMRFCTGAVLVPHGAQKVLYVPVNQFAGNIAAQGFPAPVHWKFGYFWTNRGIEYALLLWLLCTAIFFRGGGRYSLDRLMGKEF